MSQDQGSSQDATRSSSANAPAGPYAAYADELIHIGCEMGRLRASDRIGKGMRGMPAVMRVVSMADGPLSPKEIARRTGVSDARVANALRTLEERGLVKRTADDSDRRCVNVSLTELGMSENARMRDAGVRATADFLAELGEDDARELVRITGRVAQIMAARAAEGRQVRPPADPWANAPKTEGEGE